MKRIPVACIAAGAAAVMALVGAATASAASPAVDRAIKSIRSVSSDPAKLKLFCELNKVIQAAADKEDAAVQKQIEGIVTQMGPDFGAAWDVGDELDETSPDGQAFYDAVDALAEKCK
jgi:hypothetical protein